MTTKTNRKATSTGTKKGVTVEQFDDAVYHVKKGSRVFQIERRTSKMWNVFELKAGGKFDDLGSVQGLKKAIAQVSA